jgi:hypothetical protein
MVKTSVAEPLNFDEARGLESDAAPAPAPILCVRLI